MSPDSPTTGLELVLNACEGSLQLVLTDDEELLCAQSWDCSRHGTEILAPALEQAFALTGRKLANLRRIGCVRGPGSFTGIRLVLATASALRRTTRARLAALDYMQALATTVAMGEQLLYGRRIWVLTYARRGLVHICQLQAFGPVIPCYAVDPVTLAPLAVAEDLVTAACRGAEKPVYVCGSALARNPGLLEAFLALEKQGQACVRPNVVSPSVPALRLLGRHGDYFPKDVEPLYVRPCDAVENLPSLARRMGCDPDACVHRLQELLGREPHSEI